MSAPWTTQFIRQIHDAQGQLVLCVTGGGSQAISALLDTAGASRTVLEATVPYSAEALTRWLTATPEQSSSESTSRVMAMAAFIRARQYIGGASAVAVAGIACTASLASDRPKHGPHRLHAALQTSCATVAHSVELSKGRRSRGEEETVAAAVILNLVAEFKGIEERIGTGLLPEEQLRVERCDAPVEWQQLLSGATGPVAATAAASATAPCGGDRLIFSGAFNPRHDAHRQMARLAGERLGLPVEHELSILNVEKPPIDFIEMQRRAAQFGQGEPLWFSRAATFVEKSALFPRAIFIVGADTIVRIADLKYYEDPAARDAALANLAAAGCRFLVFGRHQGGCFQSLRDLRLPEALRQLCDEVPAETFRMDVSSSSLRANTA